VAEDILAVVWGLWRSRGPLATDCNFRALLEPDYDGDHLTIIVDLPGVGRKETMTVRAVRLVPLDTPLGRLSEILQELYEEVAQARWRANSIGVRV
jgi:hypothetical protein